MSAVDRKKAIIVDLDGTLANDDHRAHHLRHEDGTVREKKNWDEYFAMAGGDALHWNISELVRIMYACGHEIYILSGRREDTREVTLEWLYQHNIPFTNFRMRGVSDRTDDNVLKLKWAEEWGLRPDNVLFVLEDRNRVVKAWREAGYVCLQVAEGNF